VSHTLWRYPSNGRTHHGAQRCAETSANPRAPQLHGPMPLWPARVPRGVVRCGGNYLTSGSPCARPVEVEQRLDSMSSCSRRHRPPDCPAEPLDLDPQVVRPSVIHGRARLCHVDSHKSVPDRLPHSALRVDKLPNELRGGTQNRTTPPIVSAVSASFICRLIHSRSPNTDAIEPQTRTHGRHGASDPALQSLPEPKGCRRVPAQAARFSSQARNGPDRRRIRPCGRARSDDVANPNHALPTPRSPRRRCGERARSKRTNRRPASCCSCWRSRPKSMRSGRQDTRDECAD
jgi:hypothetical protein